MGGVRLTDDNWLTQRPYLRNIVAKVNIIHTYLSPHKIGLIFTVQVLPRGIFSSFIEFITPKYGLVLLVDLHNGEVKRSFHDPTGVHVSSVSQVRRGRKIFLYVYLFVFIFRWRNLLMAHFYLEVIIIYLFQPFR